MDILDKTSMYGYSLAREDRLHVLSVVSLSSPMIFFETVELKTLNYRRQVRAQISFARQNIYLRILSG